MRCLVVDNFLADAEEERGRALASDFQTEEHRGLDYPGIALAPAPELEERIRGLLSLQGGDFTSFYRRYLPSEKQGTFIHNDCHIGDVSGILFLSRPEHCFGGLAFWRHRLYGWEQQPPNEDAIRHLGLRDTPELWESVHKDGLEEERWQMVDYWRMDFNRLVLFRSDRYHSRYPKATTGSGPEDCRLIRTFFLKGATPCP